MPWRGAEYPGEFPTLGYVVKDWIESFCVIPDGDHAGQPFLLTDEMWRWLLWYYRIDPETGRFLYRYGMLVRPQKWGKGPLSAAMICAEAEGPTLLDGWDANGEPVGRPWPTPHIQITAYSEDQTDNVYRALQPMIELGPLANVIPDTGLTRINVHGGGLIEPVTSKAQSRLGQRVTFVVQDETHSWTAPNGMVRLGDTQRRNLAGMGGRAIGTTNAWNPAEMSYAQVLAEAARPDIYLDMRTAPAASLHNKAEVRKALKASYGDSWWVPLDRIAADIAELVERDEGQQAERFYLNRIVAGADAWLDPQVILDRADPTVTVVSGEQITLGFDGSTREDSTALVGCTEAGHLFLVAIWNRPDGGAAAAEWQVPFDQVDAEIDRAFENYKVVLLYADPPDWGTSISQWASRHGSKVVQELWTNRLERIAPALDELHTAMVTGQVTHDGSEDLASHLRNARRWKRGSPDNPRWLIRKERKGSPLKIDAAMAATLAYAARNYAVAEGLFVRKRRRVASF